MAKKSVAPKKDEVSDDRRLIGDYLLIQATNAAIRHANTFGTLLAQGRFLRTGDS